jgi:hypothetical protein
MTKAGWSLALGSQILLALGCHPNTTRPAFPPLPGAPFAELKLTVPRATGIVADAMRQDSLPVSLVQPRDGLIETPWFNAKTFTETDARRLGPDVVQVRAWLDPTKPGSSRVTMETVYRPLADPSLPDRELDRLVPSDHPVGKRVGELITALARVYGPQPNDSTRETPFGIPGADSLADTIPFVLPKPDSGKDST